MIILKNKWALAFFLGFSIFIYFWNIWINDIWIPNESFYAEASREILETGNFIDIHYNYENRFNKPPLTYWLVSLSYMIFGVNEFATRLPIVLLALGTVLLTFSIGKEIFNRNVAIVSVFVLFFSFQFVLNSRYTSPEIPITFFFTLTLYLFLIGYKNKKFLYIFLSYIALGLTVLTKGYPYIVLIGGIVVFYIIFENSFKLSKFWEDLKFLKLWLGLPLVIVIGFWWYFVMYFKYGNSFLEVLFKETIHRAVGGDKSLNPLFYISAISWAFLPYSLTFYYSFLELKKLFKNLLFPTVWFFVVLTVFTLAKGKIPVYILPAYPSMAIIVAYFLVEYKPLNRLKKYIFNSFLIIQTSVFIIGSVLLVYSFKLDVFYYWIAIFPIIYLIRYRELRLLPFISALLLFFIFSVSLLPKVEKFRPYDQIGQSVKDNLIDKSIPLIVENYFWHNLPFYTERKVLRDKSVYFIKDYSKKKTTLALIKREDLKYFPNAIKLWEGRLYIKGSESRFAVFLKYVYKALNGDMSGFEDRVLIFIPK